MRSYPATLREVGQTRVASRTRRVEARSIDRVIDQSDGFSYSTGLLGTLQRAYAPTKRICSFVRVRVWSGHRFYGEIIMGAPPKFLHCFPW